MAIDFSRIRPGSRAHDFTDAAAAKGYFPSVTRGKITHFSHEHSDDAILVRTKNIYDGASAAQPLFR